MRSGASRDAFPSGAWERHRRGGLFHMLGSGQTRMPPQERRHEEVFVWGIFLRLDWEPLREHVLAGGPASHACRRGSGSTRGFWFCGGALLPFVLRACCGSRNAKRSFAGRIPKRSLGTTQRGRGAVAVWTEGGCGGEGLTTGVVRHACRLRRDGTRRFLFGGFFCGWTGSRCGSMCWPVDRPATHAAAGAAARGALIFCFGDCFTRSLRPAVYWLEERQPAFSLHRGTSNGDIRVTAQIVAHRPSPYRRRVASVVRRRLRSISVLGKTAQSGFSAFASRAIAVKSVIASARRFIARANSRISSPLPPPSPPALSPADALASAGVRLSVSCFLAVSFIPLFCHKFVGFRQKRLRGV